MRDPFSIDWAKEPESTPVPEQDLTKNFVGVSYVPIKHVSEELSQIEFPVYEPDKTFNMSEIGVAKPKIDFSKGTNPTAILDWREYNQQSTGISECQTYAQLFHDLKSNASGAYSSIEELGAKTAKKARNWVDDTGGVFTTPHSAQENLDYARSEKYLIQQELSGVSYSVAHANQTAAIRLWEQRVKEELQEQLADDRILFGVSYEWQRKDEHGKVVVSQRLDPLSVVESQEGYRHVCGYTINGYVAIPTDQVIKKHPPHPLNPGPKSWLDETTGSGGWGRPTTPPKDPCPHTQVKAYKADGKVYVEVPMHLFNEVESMGLIQGWKHLKAHIDKALCSTYDHRLHATDSQCNESSLKLMNKVMLATDNKIKGAKAIHVSIEEPDVIDAGILHESVPVLVAHQGEWLKDWVPGELKPGQLISLPPGMTMSPLSSVLGSFYEVHDVHAPDYQVPGTLTYAREPGSKEEPTQKGFKSEIELKANYLRLGRVLGFSPEQSEAEWQVYKERVDRNPKEESIPDPEPNKIKFREFL